MSRLGVSLLRASQPLRPVLGGGYAVRLSSIPVRLPSPTIPTLPQTRSYAKPRRGRSSVDIPPLETFEKIARDRNIQGADVKLCRKCIVEWISAEQRGNTEDPHLLDKIGVTLQQFHEVAIFLERIAPPENSISYRDLCLRMLLYASSQGHGGATLTYTRLSLGISVMNESTPFRLPKEVEERLSAMVDRGDPDALTVAGKIAVYKGDTSLAKNLLNQALETGKSPTMPFEWRPACLLELGRLMRAEGDKPAAWRYFKQAAEDHELLDAWYELSYEDGFPPVMIQHTINALRGNRDACVKLSEVQNELAVEALERGNKTDFLDHQLMAHEWLKIAKATTVGEN